MSVNLRSFVNAVYGFDAVVQRVPTDHWDSASRCDGWSLRDVVAHQIGVFNAVARMARTGAMSGPRPPEVEADPLPAWNDARDDLLEALDHPGAIHHRGPYWFGAETVDDLLGFAQWDPLGHAWDIGSAIGIDPCSNQAVAAASIDVISGLAPTLHEAGLVGAPVEVPSDADPFTRFLGLTGRTP